MNLFIKNQDIDLNEIDNQLLIVDTIWIFTENTLTGCYGKPVCPHCPLHISTDTEGLCDKSIISLIYDIYKRSNKKEFIFTFDKSTHPEFFL